MLLRSISGLRGTVGMDDSGLTAEVIARYAASFAKFNGNTGTIAVGFDGRLGGQPFYDLCVQTLLTCGMDVFALGTVPTPTVQMAVERRPEIVGGISITASHNPGEWNGMKFVHRSGLFLDAEENRRLWDIVDDGTPRPVPAEHFGARHNGEAFVEEHIQAVLAIPFIDRDQIARRNFRVVLDAVNASGSQIQPMLLERLGVTDIIKLHCDSSGIFPHRPEPIPENLVSLKEAVLREKADLGIVVDPDADRLVLIMENGEPFIEENTIVLAVEQVLKSAPSGETVVVNLSTTRAVEDMAATYGATVLRTAVGEINVATRMLETQSIIGGEGSGGIILPSVHLGRDSLVGVALALSALAAFDGPISAKKAELPQYEIVKSKIELTGQEQVAAVLGAIEQALGPRAERRSHEDGLRLDFARSWLHARASNTEPIIRIIAEAPTREEALRLVEETMAVI